MKNFLKMFFACLLAIGFSFFFFFIIFTMLASLGSKSDKKSGTKANSVLNLTLKGEITDRTYDNPFRNLSPMSAVTGAISSEPTIGLYDLKNLLKYAKTDKDIKGIYLNIDEASGGPANLFDLADALEDFKKSGKFIYAYSNSSPEFNVLLNNIADKYYVNPVGGIDFDGFGTEMEYYKNLMDKLDVEFKVFYVGEYKSATESYRRTDMSPEDKIQRNEMLHDIYTEYMTRLAKYTGSTFEQLKAVQDNLSIIKPEDIVTNKLADGLKYEDEVKNEIKSKLGYKKDEDLNLISYKVYEESNKDKINKSGENKIALVFAEGTIDDSKEDEGTIGGEAYVKMLQKIEQDKDIKALVLRVSSPGGSAFASEQILHQIQNIKKRIPVVVSMGNYAASGGYYISCAADKIIAEPNTITGSIGIFGMIPDIRKTLNNKVGITFDGVKTNEHANYMTVTNDWDETEINAVQKSVENGYAIFLNRVATGRKMDTAAVNKIARGRVWTGQDAVSIGLVDELGSLDLAIKKAEELAKLKSSSVVTYPKSKTMIESLMNQFSGENESEEAKLFKTLTPLLIKQKNEERLNAVNTLQYLMPFEFKLK